MDRILTLVCNKCKIEKKLDSDNFKKGKLNKYGFRPICKKCTAIKNKSYVESISEYLIAKRRIHYLSIKEKVKKWDKNSKENIKNKSKNDVEYDRKRKLKNNTRHMSRYKTDPIYRIRHLLRSRLSAAIRKNYKTLRFKEYIGCNLDTLKTHLESKFQEGMNWGNHGNKGWHIDHIRPLSSFDLNDPEQLLIAGNYKNLQPLWAVDNLKKSSKLVV